MITLIIGRQGSGKTLYMVKMAKQYAEHGKAVYSNVHLIDINFIPINYQDIIDCKYNNALVIIDEAHQLLPSRASMTKTSRLIVDKFVSMCRKKRVHLMLSTQMARKIDIRIRLEQDFLIECSKFAYIGGKFKTVMGDSNLEPGVKTLIRCDITESYSGKTLMTSFLANEYYDHYDTSQIINIEVTAK